jgi:hypothetical protein
LVAIDRDLSVFQMNLATKGVEIEEIYDRLSG